jgi:hypothetical protein
MTGLMAKCCCEPRYAPPVQGRRKMEGAGFPKVHSMKYTSLVLQREGAISPEESEGIAGRPQLPRADYVRSLPPPGK